MELNCEPGDTAVVAHPGNNPEQVGMIVSIIRLAVEGDRTSSGRGILVSESAWIVEHVSGRPIPVRLLSGELTSEFVLGIADRRLRPLRSTDGEDEILALAGKPNKEKA